MLFNSFDFIVFFLIVFVVQLGLPHQPRNFFLLAASYFFYGYWDWRFLSLILVSTIIDFQCSHRINESDDEATRKRFLWISIAANLTTLGFFKYFNFFADSAVQLATSAGMEWSPLTFKVLLPMGISFYTFQTMSYTIDVYRRQMKPLASFWDFALYVAFFPQLVAGPIERGCKLAPQIDAGPRSSWSGVQSGTWLVAKGLFKKAVIADNLAVVVNGVFANPDPSAFQVLIGVYGFAFQIYGDFSGYTDIARGVGRMLGYDLSLNFRLPYFATSPSEFWQRWHISLSSWLRDYLYIPLGGNRGGKWMTYRNLLITMLLGGLWHGAAWTFVIWGAYQGAILMLHRMMIVRFQLSDAWQKRTYLIRVIAMFHLACMGWLIFRAESVQQIANMLTALTEWSAISLSDWQDAWKVALLCGPMLILQMAKEHTKNLNLVSQLSFLPRVTIYTIVVVAILTLGSFGQQEFIYFQF